MTALMDDDCPPPLPDAAYGSDWRDATAAPQPAPAARTVVVRDAQGTSTLAGPGHAPRPLVENGSGRVVWCVENACLMLEWHSEWRGALAYDEFAGLTMLMRPIPGTTVPVSRFKPRCLADTDITATVRWFNRNGYPDAKKQATSDALYAVAAQTIISPVRHYLESLIWDGTARVASWLNDYCGADETELTAKIGKAWLVSAVARAFEPGCKADCALVLEGRQGAGKSSVFKLLASEAWFSDGLPDMHSKDASGGLLGKWIIELPELAAMRRSDVETIKSFMSRTSEKYRPPYGRCEVIQPRRCVFGGTTNRSDYLADDTGNRRFWPVPVGRIELDQLQRDRDQIWAEAVMLYLQGERWWLDAEGEIDAAALVKTRVSDDPWEATVLNAVVGKREVSSSEIFENMGVVEKDRTRPDALRITGVLNRAGWTREGRFSGGASKGLARYVPPQTPLGVW